MSKEGLKLVLLCVGVILLVSLGFSLVDDGSSSITGAIVGGSGPLAAQATQDSCTTLNGDTEINDSISTSGGTCFVVNASHITINGQGNTITGADNDTAFELLNVINVTILDLTLQNFDYGFIVNLSDSTNITQITSTNVNTTVFYLGGPSGGVHGNHSLSDSTFDGGQLEEIRLNTTWESNFSNLTFTNQKTHLTIGADSANNIFTNPSFSTSDLSFPGILDEDSGTFNDLIFEDLTAGRLYWQKNNLTVTDQLGIGANVVIDAQGNTITLGLESSTDLANLNSSAQLRFYNQNFGTQPFVLKDGVRCDDTDACNVSSYNNGTLEVEIDSFSNYTTQSSISCGDYLNSNIILEQDLNCDGTAFIVNATGITINGDGYAIYGNGSGHGVNISNGNSGAVVESLTIANFSRAISVDSADGPALYDLNLSVSHVANGTAVVYIKDSNSPEVHNNTINASGDNTYGVFIENTESGIVADNDINTSGATAHAVYMFDNSFGSTVSNNNITSSGTGVQALRYQTDSNEITAATNVINVSGSNAHGFYADASSTSQVTANQIYLSGANATGLNFSLGATMTIANNNFTSESAGTTHIVLTSTIVTATVSTNRLISSFADSVGFYFENIGIFGGNPTGNDVLNNVVNVSGSGSTALQMLGYTNETRLTNNNFSSATNVIVDDTGSGSNNRLVYNSSYTQITWDNITNLSTDADLIVRSSVFVGENEAAFFSGSSEPYQINGSAQVELRNLTYDSTVYVLRDGSRCDDADTCNYTYTAASDSASNGTMFLNVSHFSNYSVTDTLPSTPSTPAATTDTSSGGSSSGGGGGGGSLPPSDDSESEAPAASASSEDTASETEYTTPAAILENLEIGEFISGDLSVPTDIEGEFVLIEGVLLPTEVLEPTLLSPEASARAALTGQAGSLGGQETHSESTSIAFAGSLSGALVPGVNSFAQSGSTLNVYYLPLKNNGDKTIRLLSELHQEQLDTAHFIVTRKQSSLIGQEGISGVLLAKEASDEELLEARVLIDEIVLEPGEEKFIELRVSSGISRQEDPALALLNLLTTQRELVTSFDVQVENTPVTLNAVSLQPATNTLDFYSMIINSDQEFARDATYFVEVSVEEIRESFSLFGPSVYFADLYGPYPLMMGDEYIFSQKFEYDPLLYSGQMQLRMKTLIDGETILTDLFLVDFDEGTVTTLDSALSDLESVLELDDEEVIVDLDDSTGAADSAITGNLIGRVQGRQEGAVNVIMILLFVLFLLLLFLFAPRIKRLFSKKVVSSKAKLSGQDEEEHVLVSHLQSSIKEVRELRKTAKRPVRRAASSKSSSSKTATKKARSSSRSRAVKKTQIAKKRVSKSRTKTQKKSTKNSSQKVRKRRR